MPISAEPRSETAFWGLVKPDQGPFYNILPAKPASAPRVSSRLASASESASSSSSATLTHNLDFPIVVTAMKKPSAIYRICMLFEGGAKLEARFEVGENYAGTDEITCRLLPPTGEKPEKTFVVRTPEDIMKRFHSAVAAATTAFSSKFKPQKLDAWDWIWLETSKDGKTSYATLAQIEQNILEQMEKTKS